MRRFFTSTNNDKENPRNLRKYLLTTKIIDANLNSFLLLGENLILKLFLTSIKM